MKLRYLFPLLLLLPLKPCHAAVVVNQSCTQITQLGTLPNCNLQNTGSGDKIVASVEANAGSAISLTCTETCTCPAAGTAIYPGQHRIQVCYADTTTTHANFSITTSACTGCTSNASLLAYDVAAGQLSSGYDVAAAAATTSTSFTTTHANEWAFMGAFDEAGMLTPGNNFLSLSQMNWLAGNTSSATQTVRHMGAYLVTGSAGSYTASYTDTSSLPATVIAVIAFQITGSISTPNPYIVQSCSAQIVAGTNPATGGCFLNNVVSGDTIISCVYTNGNTPDGGSTETLTYPAGANITSGGNVLGQGYVKATSNHVTFSTMIAITLGNAIGSIEVIEVKGLGPLDSGSPAGAGSNTTTTSYTTAANNEWANMCTLDTNNSTAGLHVPGNGFSQANYSIDNSNPANTGMFTNPIPTSGSHTASFTDGTPVAAKVNVMAFNYTPTVTAGTQIGVFIVGP